MENKAMQTLESIERTATKTLARLTQDQGDQRKTLTAVMQMVDAIGRNVQRLTAQIPQQNREGASYGIRHVQQQYRDRPHQSQDPEVRQRLETQVKGYAQTIRAIEQTRMPTLREPFRELFNGSFQRQEPDRNYTIPRTSQDAHNRSRDTEPTRKSEASDPRLTARQGIPYSPVRLTYSPAPAQQGAAAQVQPSTSREVTPEGIITVAFNPPGRQQTKKAIALGKIKRRLATRIQKRGEARREKKRDEEDFEDNGSPQITVEME